MTNIIFLSLKCKGWGAINLRHLSNKKNTFFLGMGGFPYHHHHRNCITCVTRDTALLQFFGQQQILFNWTASTPKTTL